MKYEHLEHDRVVSTRSLASLLWIDSHLFIAKEDLSSLPD